MIAVSLNQNAFDLLRQSHFTRHARQLAALTHKNSGTFWAKHIPENTQQFLVTQASDFVKDGGPVLLVLLSPNRRRDLVGQRHRRH